MLSVCVAHLRTRKQGGKDITYVECHTVIRYLDHYAPGWSCEVKDVIPTGTRCVVTITCRAALGGAKLVPISRRRSTSEGLLHLSQI
jgi:hypothetical protein